MGLSTDYLVVGAGASGMAFTDSLAAESDAEVIVVDKEERPGGHWVHAYPFVRLHSPSAFYGVNSRPLGLDRVDETGPNAGFYERATKAEILEHFADAAAALQATGRVRVLLRHEHLGDGRVRDLDTGEVQQIDVRRRLVDARYLEASVPATHERSFEVADGARVVPVGVLPEAADGAASYVVLGSGKTAVDACLWLLEHGVDPDRIRWVRPREAWWHDRARFQPLDQVVSVMEGIAAVAEAAAQASDADDLFARLEEAGELRRIDQKRPATMYRGGLLSDHELEQLRRITGVVRLGHVTRVERDRTLLEDGEIATGADVLHVDCTALGLRDAPPMPVFTRGRIVLQHVRHNSPSFSAAVVGYVEAHRDDDATKNRLCPPNPFTGKASGYPSMLARTWQTQGIWLAETDLARWVAGSRLNLLRALPDHQHEPRAHQAVGRFLTHVGPAVTRLVSMNGSRPAPTGR